jgi:hypothetical protein
MGQGREYRVLATRFRKGWYIEVPALDTHAECRLFADVEHTAREAIARSLCAESGLFDVAVELQRPWDTLLRSGERSG